MGLGCATGEPSHGVPALNGFMETVVARRGGLPPCANRLGNFKGQEGFFVPTF
jgi:hypothetical protein